MVIVTAFLENLFSEVVSTLPQRSDPSAIIPSLPGRDYHRLTGGEVFSGID